MKISREFIRGNNHARKSPFAPLPKRQPTRVVLRDRKPGGTLLTAAAAHSLIKPHHIPLLEVGTCLTVWPGATLQKVRVGPSARYQLIGMPQAGG